MEEEEGEDEARLQAREGGGEETRGARRLADAAVAGEGGCSLRERRVGGTRKAGEVETGGLITSHTDAVHCRGDSALAYPEAYAITHNHTRLRVGGECTSMYVCVGLRLLVPDMLTM